MRVFIAIGFNDKIKSYLHEVQEVLKIGCTKANFTRFDNFHITLRYIGETNDHGIDELLDLIDEVASNSKPFKIKLGDLGSFMQRSSKLLWLGIVEGKKELNGIYNKIDNLVEHYGFEKESRRYRPHITLARQAKFNEVCVTESIPFYDKEILIDEITLYESHRVDDLLTYTPLYTKKL